MPTDPELERCVLVTIEAQEGPLLYRQLRILCDTVDLPDVIASLIDQKLLKETVQGRRKTYKLSHKGSVAAKRIIRSWPKPREC